MTRIQQLVRGDSILHRRSGKINLQTDANTFIRLVRSREEKFVSPHLRRLDIRNDDVVGGSARDSNIVKQPLVEQLLIWIITVDLAISANSSAHCGKGGGLTRSHSLANRLGEKDRNKVQSALLLPGQNEIPGGPTKTVNGDLICSALKRIELKAARVESSAP